MQRHIRQIDAETGELIETGTLVYIPQRARIKGGWLMAFQEAFKHLAKADTLTPRETRVLHYLIGTLDFENFIHLSQADVAKELNLKTSNVSTAFRGLVQKGCLIVGPKVGRSATYRLAPELGWKGRVKSLEDARKNGLKLVIGTGDTAPEKPNT